MFKWLKKFWPGIRLRFLVYLPAAGLPVLCKYLFQAAVPLYVLFVLPVVKIVLTEISLACKNKVIRHTGQVLSALFSVLFAVTLFITIVITPLSAYIYFFSVIRLSGGEQLYAANIFTLLVAFFTLFFCAAALKKRSPAPLLGILCILTGILLIIFQNPADQNMVSGSNGLNGNFRIPVLFLSFLASLALYVLAMLKSRALPLAMGIVMCLGIALVFYFFKPESEGSKLVDEFLFPEIRQTINNVFPGFPLLMDIPGYGVGYSASHLGGSSLLTSTPVLEIKTDKAETLYLMTSTYDLYTGQNWVQSKFSVKKPEPAARDELFRDISKPRQLDMKILTEAFTAIPLTGDAVAFQYNNRLYPVNRRENWQGIQWEDLLRKNQLLRLYRIPQTPAADSDNSLYLQVPDLLPKQVTALAQGFGAGAVSAREILNRIQNYLSENYTYNLRAPVVRDNEDFVAKFLFDDKRGYCTHFASAFIILARLNHIPARYATGYLVHITDTKAPKTVTARSAHAWPEVWLPGQGWVAWEATTVVNADYYSRYAYELEMGYLYQYYLDGNGIARNPVTLRQLQELLGIKLKFREDGKKTPGLSTVVIPAFLYWILAAVLICALATAGIITARQLIGFNPQKKFNRCIKQLIKTFKRLPLPEQTGWIQWQQNLCKYYSIEQGQAAKLLEMVLKTAYGNKPAGREELAFLKTFRKHPQIVPGEQE